MKVVNFKIISYQGLKMIASLIIDSFFCNFTKKLKGINSKFLAKNLLVLAFFASFVNFEAVFAKDGISEQTDCLFKFVKDYSYNSFSSDSGFIDEADLCKKLSAKAREIGLDMVFGQSKNGNKLNLCGFSAVGNCQVCDVVIEEQEGSFKVEIRLNPNGSGCIKDAENGNLSVDKPIEKVFVKNGDRVDIAGSDRFAYGDKNIYKVIQYPCIHQETEGPCGYYALGNLLKAVRGEVLPGQLLNWAEFDGFYKRLKALNCDLKSMTNGNMREIIKSDLLELNKDNVMISVEMINRRNKIEASKVYTFASQMSVKEKIRDFQVNGITQYLIIGTGSKKENSSINGLSLNWDNSLEKLNCVEDHWLALKIEWANPSRPGKCPVILSVFDSSGPKDNRFATLIHWYYYLFAHTK